MILDRVENWKRYPLGPAWAATFEWIERHMSRVPTKVVPLDGDRLVVRPGRYATLDRDDAVLESHRRFADVQVMIRGHEWAEFHDPSTLAVTAPYDPKRDVEFYAHPYGASTTFRLDPGLFAFFLPGEAHMTQMAIGQPGDKVLKVVVKIDAALLGPVPAAEPPHPAMPKRARSLKKRV